MRLKSSNSGTNYYGVGLGGLLGTAFVVLKLCGVISWSWLWVLSPFWIPFAILLFVWIIAVIIAVFN